MNTAYSYIRMSTAIQLKGSSKKRQEAMAQKYASENNLILDDSLKLTDIGVSAFKGKNSEEGKLGLFLDKIKSGDIKEGSYLLIESLDRLSRDDVVKAQGLLYGIVHGGITVVTLTDGAKYNLDSLKNFSTLIVSLAIMSRSNEESEVKSKRIKASWEYKRANITSKKLTSRCPSWLELSEEKTHFIEIKERVDVVKKIFKLAIEGAGSYAIVRQLNDQGVPKFTRKKPDDNQFQGWQQSYVTKILTNRFVIGEYQPKKRVDGKSIPAGDVIKDYYPRVISDADFYLVQSQRKSRRNGGGNHGSKLTNLFSRIVECGECGSTVKYINKGKKPKGGQYLICTSRHLNNGCNCQYWQYKEFENSFIKFITEVNIIEIMNNNIVKTTSELKALNDEISILMSKKDRLNQENLTLLKLISVPETEAPEIILKQMNMIEANLAQIEIDIKNKSEDIQIINRQSSQMNTSVNDIKKLDESMSGLNDSEIYQRRLVASSRIREITDKIVINFNGIPTNRSPKNLTFKEKFSPKNTANMTLELINSYTEENVLSYDVYFKRGGVRSVYFTKDLNWSIKEPTAQ